MDDARAFRAQLKKNFQAWLEEGHPDVPFDLYAQSPDAFAHLRERLPACSS